METGAIEEEEDMATGVEGAGVAEMMVAGVAEMTEVGVVETKEEEEGEGMEEEEVGADLEEEEEEEEEETGEDLQEMIFGNQQQVSNVDEYVINLTFTNKSDTCSLEIFIYQPPNKSILIYLPAG